MDPVSQGITGSAAALLSKVNKQDLGIVIALGFLSGLAPDLDVLIRSGTDPLLSLEFHRQFTHALIFIPLGGLLCAFLAYFFVRSRLNFNVTYIACTLGYGTHGLLDACTTYGTQLFWPFTNDRVAFNTISIIDPLYTLPLIILIVLAFVKKSGKWGRYACLWIVFYQLVGFVQYERAMQFAKNLAKNRQHLAAEVSVKPSFANLILWKSIYLADGYYYVDAVNLLGGAKLYKGSRIKKFSQQDLQLFPAGSVVKDDIERFSWFSGGYVAWHPEDDKVIADIRYSLLPDQILPLWGIVIPEDTNKHVDFVSFRAVNEQDRGRFLQMLLRNKV